MYYFFLAPNSKNPLHLIVITLFILLNLLNGYLNNISFANSLISLSLFLQLPIIILLVTQISSIKIGKLVLNLRYLVIVQFFVAIVQIFIWIRPGDSINGTMLGEKHGTHILQFLLYAVLISHIYFNNLTVKKTMIYFIIISLIAYKSDAKIVMIAIIAFFIAVMFKNVLSSNTQITRRLLLSFCLVMIIYIANQFNLSGYITGRWGYELSKSFSSKMIVLRDFSKDSDYSINNSLLTGAGPTQTVSRGAVIASVQASSSQANTPLTPSYPMYYKTYSQTTGKFSIGGISSIMQPVSSLVGLIGDQGILGTLLWISACLIPLRKAIRQRGHSENRFEVYLLFFLFLFPLSFFNTFLEFPEATIVLAITLIAISQKENLN